MIPKVGSKAPNFSVKDENENLTKLSDFKGSYLILYFYPKDNTPGCTIEARDFSSLEKEFKKLNAKVVGVSADSCASHKKFIDKQDLTIQLLADTDKVLTKAYGVWGPKKFMGREFLGVKRTTFLIDPKGKVVHVWESVKAKGHAEDVLSTLEGKK